MKRLLLGFISVCLMHAYATHEHAMHEHVQHEHAQREQKEAIKEVSLFIDQYGLSKTAPTIEQKAKLYVLLEKVKHPRTRKMLISSLEKGARVTEADLKKAATLYTHQAGPSGERSHGEQKPSYKKEETVVHLSPKFIFQDSLLRFFSLPMLAPSVAYKALEELIAHDYVAARMVKSAEKELKIDLAAELLGQLVIANEVRRRLVNYFGIKSSYWLGNEQKERASWIEKSMYMLDADINDRLALSLFSKRFARFRDCYLSCSLDLDFSKDIFAGFKDDEAGLLSYIKKTMYTYFLDYLYLVLRKHAVPEDIAKAFSMTGEE